MAFSFFSKNPRTSSYGQELSLVIEIESGLVRGSLVLFSHDAVSGPDIAPRIFHRVSMPIAPRIAGGNGSKLTSSMLSAVAGVTQSLVHEGLRISSSQFPALSVSKIHVIFSSPWIISKTKTVKVSYAKDTEITKSTVGTILSNERKELENRFIAEHNSSSELDLAFIEQKIFEVKLNGYATAHFEGKKARELEVSFAISIGSKNILNAIEKTVEKFVRTQKQRSDCHSSLLLQYTALRNLVLGRNDYIAVHVHDQISDVIVIKNGVCAALASFPLGTVALAKTSAAALRQSHEVTKSSLTLQSKGALHATESTRVAGTAAPALTAWSEQFIKTLESAGLTDSIPRHIYLLANEHYAHFERSLAAISIDPAGHGKSFEVSPIEKSILDTAVTHEKKELEDPLMSMYVFALR